MFYRITKYLIFFQIGWINGFGQDILVQNFKVVNNIEPYRISNIRSYLEDAYGFTWIATQDGLFRFDSKNVVYYNTQEAYKNKIAGSDVRSLAIDTSKNILWCAATSGGINAIDLNTGSVIKTLNADNAPFLKEVAISKIVYNDGLLFTCSSKGVYCYNTDNEKGFVLPGTNNELFNNIIVSGKTLVLFSMKTGLLTYDLNSQKITDTIDTRNSVLKDNIRVFDVMRYNKNEWFFSSTNGIKKITIVEKEKVRYNDNPFPKFLITNNSLIFGLCLDKEQDIWFSNENGLYKLDPKNEKIYSIRDNNFSSKRDITKSVFTLFCDSDNRIWLGGIDAAAYTTNKKIPFKSISESQTANDKIEHAYYIHPFNDSILYVCAEDGLHRCNINTLSIKTIDNTRSYDYQFTDPSGKQLVSNSTGLFILNGDNLTPAELVYREFMHHLPIRINSHIFLSDSCIAFGTENHKGILIWNFKVNTLEQYNTTSSIAKLDEDVVNNVFKISENRMLVLSDNYISLFDYKLKQCKSISKEKFGNKQYSLFFDICKVKGYYYLASYGSGVLVLNDALEMVDQVNTSKGLSNNGVYKILPWNDSLLFITTNNGLNVYDLSTHTIKKFYKNDGLHDDAFEETSANSYKKVLYAGGANGISIIYPENINYNNSPPLVYFSKIQVDLSGKQKTHRFDSSNLEVTSFIIPNNYIQTSIYFSAINYSDPKHTTFAYRIIEQNKEWINLQTQNFVTPIGLSPGTYTLQVQAFNEDGVPSEIKELILIFEPKWYQTWWFKVLLLFVIASAIYGLYRIRINQLKKEEKIRNQVAGDLHDELGSTLNSVKVFTNLALMEKENTSHLEKIKEATQSAISGVKDIIWVLDDKRDTLDHLLGRINQFARPICEAAGISYKQQSGGNENYKLGKEEKRNLYMIIKESINNSIKYSECSVIELLIKNNGGKLSVSVSDDGKGFDKNEIVSGYGLKNIMRRSEEINYHAVINSSPGNGTLIYLEKK